ncbi:hypothetical protein EYZ11_005865 [Aspergillus tanneri]|uniref:Developmental regulatory protein wetA n=1 Tax=Aspergillus tanneri TaxID=1220188 RepID=A0A4S3JGZ4_9EURO|nr:uncharacterized protein ATNIH1004_002542 [Aspergillus tanneri]KAA8649863.1 hypothetical protein ATNIH1004_002542 [Aspergillus tanneri]THC94643.1 hypothetical protein EYZ11_005865 [Aspergillus tanneri]
MFAQPFDHSFNDLFNQCVDVDPSTVDGNKDVSFPGDLDQLFSFDSLSSECGDLSPSISASKRALKSPQHWSRDLWCAPQDAAPSAGQAALGFPDTIHPSTVSDLNVNLEASSPKQVRSPSTPPTTPNRKTKNALVTPKSIRRHCHTNDNRSPLRKQSSPSLMRSSQLQKSRMAYPDAWAQSLQNFSIGGSDDRLPLSPPPSDILVQHENLPTDGTSAQMNHPGDSTDISHHFDSTMFTQSPAISMPSPSAGALARKQQRYLSRSNPSGIPTSSSPPADDIFSSPHSSDPQSLSSWHSDPALPFTPDLHNHDAQAWWSPMASRVAPQRQPSYQQVVASPAPQRRIHNTTNQHDMLQGGLMIQLDPTPFDMPGTADPSFPASNMPRVPSVQENHTYSHVPTTLQKFVDSSSFAPQIQNSSRSPSLSPRAGSPRDVMRNETNIKTPQRQNHGRKLSSHSMNAPRQVKGTGRSTGSPKSANRSVMVSFVNFTPDDSKKILTGVAPSGSSKTKARREQEARDRRRKMSEAALNAVRKAGGDVEALEAVLC